MTDEQRILATKLRNEGMSYVKIAARITATTSTVSESSVFKFLKGYVKPPTTKLKAAQKPKRPPAALLLLPLYHGSIPMRRREPIPNEMRRLPKPTADELRDMFVKAWRNTARLAS
jgi:hypothetical protein